jgi:hypothetical protein
MARKVGYLFGTERDLDRALLSSRITLGTNLTNNKLLANIDQPIIFAKVDTGQSGKDVTATQVVWNATTEAFEAPPGTAWRFNSTANSNGEDYTTTNLQSHQDLSEDDVVEVVFYADKSETEQWLARTSSGGSLVYATSPNTTFDASFTYGATVPFPGDTAANSTALGSDALFYISTPWNTRISAPDKFFTFWNKIGSDYYLPIRNFFVKPTVDYPTSGGITTFTCYLDDSATFSLGTNTAFPSGVEVILNGFTNATASSDVREYFNGQTFPATYDSENNIVYVTHPRF